MPKRFTLKTARGYLTGNIIWPVKRTRRLYVKLAPRDSGLPKARRHGYFEPVLLCLCWCDFLGALYFGEGIAADRRRIVGWLRGPMAKQNRLYRTRAEKIYKAYRNGLVHGFEPKWFYLSYNETGRHLTNFKTHGVRIDIPTLLDDLIKAIYDFAMHLQKSRKPVHGSIKAFNKGWQQTMRLANKP